MEFFNQVYQGKMGAMDLQGHLESWDLSGRLVCKASKD
jgi:hypothetical protein